MMNTINIALSGLNAAGKKVQAAASNIANVQTSGSTEQGTDKQAPYSPIEAVQKSDENGGVQSSFSVKKNSFIPAYDPDSPFADENGLIGVPNVDLAEEAVNLNIAEVSYKASIATLKTAEEMSNDLLRIFDEDA